MLPFKNVYILDDYLQFYFSCFYTFLFLSFGFVPFSVETDSMLGSA